MALPTVRRYLWTREAYDRAIAAGGFDEDDRIELLDGELWEMSPQGTRHAAVVHATQMTLSRVFGEGFCARCQLPIALDEASEPEPDVAVSRGEAFDFLDDHPSEYVLLVEVSWSSLAFDRGRKLAAYARNAVPEYWIVDLAANRLEVYREPAGDGYASVQHLSRGDRITPLHAPQATIALSELLPPK